MRGFEHHNGNYIWETMAPPGRAAALFNRDGGLRKRQYGEATMALRRSLLGFLMLGRCLGGFSFGCIFLSAQSFSQTVYYQTLDRHVIEARLREGPDKNEKRKQVLEKMFLAAGCRFEQLIEQPVKGKKLPNLICILPGEIDSTIIVGGHYDLADIGYGAVDNWSGASLLPSLYESLQNERRRHTFVFVSFYAEEQGLVGSESYVRQLTKKQLARIPAMVNLDCLGLSSTKVEIDQSDKRLLSILDKIAERTNLPLEGVNVSKIGKSDIVPFQNRKIPVISIHSVTQETFRILHSVRDNMDAISLNDYYNTYRLMTAFLSALDVLLN
jgi:hypothetical protein